MVLKIGTTDVSKVVMTCKKSQACRGQSVQYSLNGTAHVDRFGDYKTTINISFGVMPVTSWTAICDLLKSVSTTVDADGTSYTMHLSGEIPEAYCYKDPIKGDCVSEMEVSLEEI